MFTLLAAHGLTAFYSCDVKPGRSQRDAVQRDPSRFEVLDDPDVVDRLVTNKANGAAVVRFSVPTLHCASCLWLLEQLWRFDAGIARSEVDLVRRTVYIEFQPDRTSVRRVAEQLARLGYEPVMDSERLPGRMDQVHRDLYLKIGIAGFAFGNVMVFSIPRYVSRTPIDPDFARLFSALNVVLALPVLCYSAAGWFRSAWIAVRARALTLDVPVALGLGVLFARSVVDIASGRGEGFLDSFSGLVFFLLIGRVFQQRAFDAMAFDRTARSFFPLSVRVRRAGEVRTTPIERLERGDIIAVRVGEVVPADALLIDASGSIDYAFVTGEARPVIVRTGETIHAGGRVVGRMLRLTVTRPVSHSRLGELWSNPVFGKPKVRWLVDLSGRFGAWFAVGAVALALVGAVAWWPDVAMSASVATAVLIIACPCALTLAAPITLGTAMGVLGRNGCYLKDPAVALDLSRIDTIAFDKTGTLTSAGNGSAITHEGFSDDEWASIQRLCAQSVHPIGRAIAEAESASFNPVVPGVGIDIVEAIGQGMTGYVDGSRVVVGTSRFVAHVTGRDVPVSDDRVWAAVGDGAPASIVIAPMERPGVDRLLAELASSGLELWLLSGDRARARSRWAAAFGGCIRFGQTADEKLASVRERMAAGRHVLMVGDGLNDAGALAAADVGIAVSDDTACIVPACDAVIRGDRVVVLAGILRYARRARAIILVCFAISIVYNVAGVALALAGRLTPLVTAILMPASSITVVGLSAGLTRRAAKGVLPA